MSEPVMTDQDVIALVRKEFERKIADYCKKHGIECPGDQDEEDVVVSPDDAEDDQMGARKPPTGKKPENLSIAAIMNSIGLRIAHKDSGLEYYVREIYPSQRLVDLESPEGTRFQVDFEEIEKDYKLG